jgi:hypothetical protein
MFQKLQNKWKVSTGRLILVITTFAIGGSLCGYAGKKIMSVTPIEKGIIWVFLYVLLVTILWPVAVLLVSIPLGQFIFFKNYIKKIFSQMSDKFK